MLVPLSKPRTSDAVEHKFGGKQGPMMNDGRTVTKSIPFSLQNSHAALSASIFDIAYHAFKIYTLQNYNPPMLYFDARKHKFLLPGVSRRIPRSSTMIHLVVCLDQNHFLP